MFIYHQEVLPVSYQANHKEVERKLRWVEGHVIDLSDHFRSVFFDDPFSSVNWAEGENNEAGMESALYGRRW